MAIHSPACPDPLKPRRRGLRLALAAALAPLLQACSPLRVINALTPSDTHTVQRGVPYGDGERQQLDIYRPAQPAPNAPVALFFYGGSWSSGSRADYTFVGEALASQGIVTLVADYGLSPAVRYPGFLQDCALAVDWALARLPDWSGRSLCLVGHSAGAYNAAMLALDPRWLAGVGRHPSALNAWVGLAGPYDFLPIGIPEVQTAFHWPDTPPDSQPLFHAQRLRAAPPALLLAARQDVLVNPQRNSVALAQALAAQGVSVELALLDRLSHATLVGALAKPLRGLAPVLPRVAGFIQARAQPLA